MADRPLRDPAVTGRTARTTDRSPWNWLLLVPVLAVLWPPLFNRNDPELFGIPFFYWYQLAVIPIGVTCTYLVYRASVKADRERGER